MQVLVARDGVDEPVETNIKLDGAPLRVGISFRNDESEPNSVVVSRVVLGNERPDAECPPRPATTVPTGDGDEPASESDTDPGSAAD